MKNILLLILISILLMSCGKKDNKEYKFVFKIAKDDNYGKYDDWLKADRSYYSLLKVFLDKEKDGCQNSFNANILKDRTRYYLLFPRYAEFGNDNSEQIWYKLLFFDSSLNISETYVSKQFSRLNEDDTLNWIKQTVILKIENKYSSLFDSVYIFSQSFGNDLEENLKNPPISEIYIDENKKLKFNKLYFAFSYKYGFIHLPFLEEKTKLDNYFIPYFDDNSLMYNIKIEK